MTCCWMESSSHAGLVSARSCEKEGDAGALARGGARLRAKGVATVGDEKKKEKIRLV